MTVIRGKKTYSFSKPGSSATSDTESLHLGSASASDTESLNNEPHSTNHSGVFRSLPVKPFIGEDPVHLKKSSGRKKIRRFQNRCLLQTLSEEDENDGPFVIIMEPYKSSFAKLLEDADAMEYWHDFIEKSEEEQEKIIHAFSYKCDKSQNIQRINEVTLGRVSSRVKRTLKIKKNLSVEVVKKCEDDLLDFFTTTPDQTYIQTPATSFDRLLIKAIAHYHGLQSKNIALEGSSKPSVEIHNTKENWVPADCFLTDFIQQLR